MIWKEMRNSDGKKEIEEIFNGKNEMQLHFNIVYLP